MKNQDPTQATGEEQPNSSDEKPTRYWSEMPLTRLRPSPDNARRRFDEAAIRDLAASIAVDGIINPLTVIMGEETDAHTGKPTCVVIAGERRRRAAALAGLEHVPVVLLQDPHLIANATRIAIAENALREPLNAYEETIAYLDLTAHRLSEHKEKWQTFRAQHPSDRHAAGHAIWLLAKGGKRHAELADRTGITAKELEAYFSGLLGGRDGFRPNSFVSNRLQLLDLPPEVQAACQSGELDYTKANLVASIEDEELRQAVLDRAMQEHLTHKQLATIVKEARGKREPPPEVVARLKRVERALKSSWLTLPDEDRARAGRLLDDLEKIAMPTKRQRPAGTASGTNPDSN